MPHSSDFYVNGLNETLEDSIRRMKGFNAKYLREMHTVAQAEDYFKKVDSGAMSPRQMSKDVQRTVNHRLGPSGRLPILCKDGKTRNYDPASWSNMMARTRSRTLQEEGLHKTMADSGFDLVIVSRGGSGDECRLWEGKILSISGKTPGYPTYRDAQRSGEVFHPNCVHVTSPFLPNEVMTGACPQAVIAVAKPNATAK